MLPTQFTSKLLYLYSEGLHPVTSLYLPTLGIPGLSSGFTTREPSTHRRPPGVCRARGKSNELTPAPPLVH